MSAEPTIVQFLKPSMTFSGGPVPQPTRVVYELTPEQLDAIAYAAAVAARDATPEPMLPERALNQRELAAMLDRSTEHIRQLERRGEIVSVRDGTRRLYTPEAIAALFARRLDGLR